MVNILRVLSALLIVLYMSPRSLMADGGTQPDSGDRVRTFVQRYVKADFECIEGEYVDFVRLTVISTSPQVANRTVPGAKLIDCGWDPSVLVSSFKVLDVRYGLSGGEATVAYRRIGKAEQGIVTLEPPHDEIVRLSLINGKERWWILDPPLPHLSHEVLIRYYENFFAKYDDNWKNRSHLSKEQMEQYLRKQEALRVLRTIGK